MLVLYLVVFIGLTGVGIIIPLFPFFGEQVGASPAEITMLMAVFALGQFVAAPVWGWWSDRVGRKPVFVITLAGSGGNCPGVALCPSCRRIDGWEYSSGLCRRR